MNLKFEIEDMVLRQKKSSTHKKNDLDNLFCSFVFTTPEWKHIDKYAVFWNRKGKSTIRYLGKGIKEQCDLPEIVLNDLFFHVQVYANDDVYTQKLKVFTLEDVPVEKKHGHHEKKFLNDFFKKMDKKIDNIIYDDGKFLIYANNKLIKSIDIVDEKLISNILNGIAPQIIVDMAISENSDLPVSSRLVYQALQEKVDKDSLAQVAYTGSYNDLTDIPDSFTPSPHTHQSDDIENWNDSIEEDLDSFVEDLIENL